MVTERITWTNITVSLGDLKPWAENPRMSTKKQAKRLLDSWETFGQVETIAVGPGLEVYDGHQRLSALLTVHGKSYSVDARQSSRALSDDERRKLVITLHAGAVGSWNWDSLSNWNGAQLVESGFDADLLKGWKNDIAGLKELIDSEKPPVVDVEPEIDKAEELRAKWGVESGQLWQLGEHRIICGDCTDRAVVERVMRGERAALCVTDPPYGVDYDGGANNDKKREKLSGDDDIKLYNDFLKVAPFENECALYMWHAGRRANDVYNAAINAGFEIRTQIIWHKLKAHYGAWMAQYKQKHEPCIYCVRESPIFIGETNEVTVWEYNQPSRNEYHPTEKPIELMTRAIGNHPYELVYEPFSGSGTTLIACEQLNRKCRAVEISPAYVAVAIERWVTLTGGVPELLTQVEASL